MSPSPLDFDFVNNALARVNATAEAAESHGILCGLLCIKGALTPEEWISYLVEDPLDGANMLVQESVALLKNLYDYTVEQIDGGEYDLVLVLPDDDTDVQMRIENLSLWCQGFLVGLSIGGLTDLEDLPEDSREVAMDIVEISQAGMDPDEESDPNESAYAEVVEYVRMGVLVIYGEMNPPQEVPPDASIH